MSAAEDLPTVMPDGVEELQKPVRRLCSEIQLFDLCDLNQCSYRDGRFCTNQELLNGFEKIADVDNSSRISLHAGSDDEDSDFDEDDEPDYNDGYDDGDEYGEDGYRDDD